LLEVELEELEAVAVDLEVIELLVLDHLHYKDQH